MFDPNMLSHIVYKMLAGTGVWTAFGNLMVCMCHIFTPFYIFLTRKTLRPLPSRHLVREI